MNFKTVYRCGDRRYAGVWIHAHCVECWVGSNDLEKFYRIQWQVNVPDGDRLIVKEQHDEIFHPTSYDEEEQFDELRQVCLEKMAVLQQQYFAPRVEAVKEEKKGWRIWLKH